MFVILNLVTFISLQLILAPCIYAADMSKATDIFIQRSNVGPLIVAINDNQYMKEIQELEQEEKELGVATLKKQPVFQFLYNFS